MNHSRDPQAAEALINATLAIAAAGKPLMERLLAPGDSFVEWEHYPPDDAVDHASACRYFYHAHAAGERGDGEHGHFHLFLERTGHLAATPALAEPVDATCESAAVSHLVAVAIDLQGLPTGLFTVNRWVTDEWLLPASTIVQRLPAYSLARAAGDHLVGEWLTALVRFFAPDITELLKQRDVLIGSWTPERFEDREAEVLTSLPIDINQAVGVVQDAS